MYYTAKRGEWQEDSEKRERQILWSCGGDASSDDVVSRFLQQKEWERPAILTLLKRLEKKGFVRCRKDGRRNLYTALVGEKEYLAFESRGFLDRLYGSSVKKLVATLYRSHDISAADLEELRQFLEEEKKP